MARMSSSMLILTAIIIGVGIGLLGLNYWHTSKCSQGHSQSELDEYYESLNRRLLQAETLAIRNELLMQKVIQSMQTRVYKLESSELQKITKQSQDEAIRISLILAAHPAPPMPAFDLDPQFTDPEALAQAVDDILGKVKDGSEYGINYFEEYTEGKGDGKGSGSSSVSDAPPLSDVEATKLCTEWKTNYSVVTGVSWGNLPYDLQQKWLHYSCDYHLGDPNTGGTKVTSTGASSSSSGQGADVLLQYDDKNFFLEENKEEGAAKAPSRDRR